MIKKVLFTLTIALTTIQIQAQVEEPRELTCFNKWSQKFDERGAEDIVDGVYTDVIITSRLGSKANCWSGKAEVRGKKLVKFYIIKEDNSEEEVTRTWKANSNKEVTIINGISTSMITVHNELINVLWPKKIKAAVSHHDLEVAELRADRELAVEYLKAAMESLDNPDDRAAGLLALRTVAEAYGGLGAVAAEAGISRESLYRTLSAKGNPTLKTLLAVLKAVGMKLSVEPEHHATA